MWKFKECPGNVLKFRCSILQVQKAIRATVGARTEKLKTKQQRLERDSYEERSFVAENAAPKPHCLDRTFKYAYMTSTRL